MSVQRCLPQRPLPVGSGSLALGTLGVALFGSPWLPTALPPMVRYFPLFLTVPVGICAILDGINSLLPVRGLDGVPRWRARTGIALGALVVTVPVALLAVGYLMLSHAYAHAY
ncbi:hypothetical protein OG432_18045 [Streptomyces sp. NBC_00442]|uniref:hypothetical protein n=1 Tax=Streptomyces sp. NBC_00442 TaxID=2903651 RepID=UPI002E24B5BD